MGPHSSIKSIIMKTLLLLFGLVSTCGVMSQPAAPSSLIHLRMQDESAFCVMINNQPPSAFGFTADIWVQRPGMQNLKIFRKVDYYGFTNMQLVWEENIRIAANREIYARVCPINGIRIEQQFVRPAQPQVQLPVQPVICAYPMPVQPIISDGCASINMSDSDWRLLVQSLQQAPFEQTRLNIFKQALTYHYLTVAQLSGILGCFSFEQSKLDAARLAHPRVTDPQNYHLLSYAFSFSSSMEQFNDYVASL